MSQSPMKPQVKEFFDPATWTLTFVVSDPATKASGFRHRHFLFSH